MASLFSLQFFERCNACCYWSMLFTPRELFTYGVIITLYSLNAKSTHPSDVLHSIHFQFTYTIIPYNYLYSYVLPFTSTYNIVKDSPNHVTINMIGLAQTSCEIFEDADFPIFPVVLSIPDSLQFNCDRNGIPSSTFCAELNTIYILMYVQFQRTAL